VRLFSRGFAVSLLFATLIAGGIAYGVIRYVRIGKQPDGSYLIPTGQLLRPAGYHISVNDRPLGMALSPDGNTLAVVTGSNFNPRALHLIDVRSRAVSQTIAMADSFVGVAFNKAGDTLYVGGNGSGSVPIYRRQEGGQFAPAGAIAIPMSAPTGLSLSPDEKTLYVALNLNHTLGIVDLNTNKITEVPVGAYPYTSVVTPDGRFGVVSLIDMPNTRELAEYTTLVRRNNRVLPPSPPARPSSVATQLPIPMNPGQGSPIKHVFFIIKENRTYDQVFGDLPQANGDATLVQFGRNVTPNHHALVEQFAILDNYYGPGDQSALGHRWCTQGYASDWVMKYSNGRNDQNPMLFAPNDFIWDAMKRYGKTVRSYGERGLNTFTPPNATWMDFYSDWKNGTKKVSMVPRAQIVGLRDVYSPNVAAATDVVPDQMRADGFLKEFADFEKNGNLPDLVVLLLYNDHTEGTTPGFPTPRAQVADNDLALGRVVEAISKSRYWKESAIFVTEDDSQDGTDHVDGHRTVGLVISPYVRHHVVDSTFYTIINMFRTIEQILGIAPMNQFDLAAEPMFSLFTSTPDLTPYASIPNNVPLDEMNPPISQLGGLQRELAIASTKMDFSEPDAAPADLLNRVIWHSVKGYNTPYPPNGGRKAQPSK
jgi:YVTN family beta-propeller protein